MHEVDNYIKIVIIIGPRGPAERQEQLSRGLVILVMADFYEELDKKI
jgi:hypothetical protein